MSFRELPQPVEQVLAAARRIDPVYGFFVTFAPGTEGPAWELHPHRRWLVLRDLDGATISAAVACSLLAGTAHLGKGTVTVVPEHLLSRHQAAMAVLTAALYSGAQELATSSWGAPAKSLPPRCRTRPC